MTTFEDILDNSPKIVKHIHEDDAFNICDGCEAHNKSAIWVWWNDSQICLDCFYLLSKGIKL